RFPWRWTTPKRFNGSFPTCTVNLKRSKKGAGEVTWVSMTLCLALPGGVAHAVCESANTKQKILKVSGIVFGNKARRHDSMTSRYSMRVLHWLRTSPREVRCLCRCAVHCSQPHPKRLPRAGSRCRTGIKNPKQGNCL